ncbi:similar to Saccharomyces cerevisiae YJL090C DPB11 Replication initiation protein that loads DNA pol epsilon onto pre-replication complexes at origins [Maudiozyma saulgeensis]|uniref:Similar to Saccharomyces cerevisiae YJL090C DPB11 Replication initiation protein that loads DNA pol epsilon onto pre-replication complexes at origins n=1 Tax=Maudiozyma saulgeensis TaxID=1789683 RepID=A0A1X7R7Y9_9SACH|nr:similar to Saccharomyces cerevisiae YJL090C DPB11 Replication initiation protein that loads DNA pol epsilon onto pre-replication complexes at origins [Kazachstania saulgeensis]
MESQSPFKGLLFCFTGLDQEVSKSYIKKIVKLGGQYNGDLTPQANVLVIGSNPMQSAKYQFVTMHRNDMAVIHFSTIDQLYDIWVNGDDISCKDHFNYQKYKNNDPLRMLHVLHSRYEAKPLTDFYIFLGRCQNEDIKELEFFCRAMGCIDCNSTQFIMDIKITHPNKNILFITDSTNSARAQAALSVGGIPLVHFKWLRDCFIRDLALQYDPYYLVENTMGLSYEEIGVGACDSVEPRISIPSQHLTPTIGNIDSDDENTSHRLMTNKLKPKVDKIWERTFASNDNNKQKTSDLTTNGKSTTNSEPTIQDEPIHGCFHGCIFTIHRSFDSRKYEILEKVITKNDGSVHTRITNANYLIVPSNMSLDSLNIDPNLETMPELVTEFFIERCYYYKKLISPPDSWSKPFLYTSDFKLVPSLRLLQNHNDQVLNIAITGFYGVELLQLKKILELMQPMGICFSEFLNRKTDILLLNIASLNSIPRTHALWTNEYSDLLLENYKQCDPNSPEKERQNIHMSPVFKKSMKEKINFAREKHPIPIITPAFIMDIFHTARVFTRNIIDDEPKIRISDSRWTVCLPRGNASSFICRLKYIDPTKSLILNGNQDSPNKQLDTKVKKEDHISRPSSNFSSAKAMAQDVVNIMHTSSSAPQKLLRKRVQQSETSYKSSPSPIKQETMTIPTMKRPKLAMVKKPRPVEREVSWGSMISDELKRTGQDKIRQEKNEIQVQDSVENNEAYTQVTYGRRDQVEPENHTTKRMTRHHAKELGI